MPKAATVKKASSGTSTSAFGTVSRQGHDSSSFYDKKIYSGQGLSEILNIDGERTGGSKNSKSPGKPKTKNTKARAADKGKKVTKKKAVKQNKTETTASKTPDFPTNVIYCGDSRNMHQIPDNSIGLMVTSPPYNVGKEYDDDLSLKEYKDLLHGVLAETHRVLCDGGRACINIANIGRKPYIPLHTLIIKIMDDIGYLMRGEIIWNKAASAGGSCAWGSWQSANNPVLRDVHEYILVYSKASYNRKSENPSTIEKQNFLDYTKSIWTFHATSAQRAGHPAPFPVELPQRLIELYSFKDDIILDPFMGSGSTAIAALHTERRYVGYDLVKDYVKLAEENIGKVSSKLI